ncbi:MAG: peptidoglycan-associated lipoprotein Pal [Burkholderiaceae bacterium]|nr:peptidoglycan-associated lipoprotein Pal [Burkholderiaceae bacterium]
MKLWQLSFSALAAAALVGCGSTVKLDDKAPVETRATTPAASASTTTNANAGGVNSQSQVASVDLGAADVAKAGRLVYFDFDSYVVKDEYRNVIDAHAKRLNADRKVRLSIEGHTDERGGREYNLALGQKRAEAVAKSLTLLGATEAQAEPVSFGKERPAVQGSDEAAWAKNRRAELKDK